MVRVPTTQGPTVEPRATPFVPQSTNGLTADALNGAARAQEQSAREMMGAASQWGDRLLQRQEEDNKREATKLENDYTEQLRKLGYGDGTADNPGFYGTYGENAIGSHNKYREEAVKARQELLDKAPNDKVREIFGLRSGYRQTQEFEQFDRHLLRERNKANDETGQARIKEAHADAVANRNNSVTLGRSLDIAESEMQAAGKRNGWTPEITAAKIREGQSMILKDVILSNAVDDPQRALAIYMQHKDKIAGQHHDDIERAVKGGVTLRLAQEITDRVISEGGTHKDMLDRIRNDKTLTAEARERAISQVNTYMGVVHSQAAEQRAVAAEQRAIQSEQRTLSRERAKQEGTDLATKAVREGKTQADAAKMILDITDTDVRHEFERNINMFFSMQERAKMVEKRDAQLEAHQLIDGGLPVSKIPARVRQHLDGTTISALEKIEERRASGKPWVSDNQYYVGTIGMTADQLLSVNMIDARTKLDDADYRELRTRVNAAAQGRYDEKAPGSIKQLFDTYVTQIYGEHSKWKDKKDVVRDVAEGLRRVREEVAAEEQKNNGRKLKENEIQDIVSRTLVPKALERAEKDWFWRRGSEQDRILDTLRVPPKYQAYIIQKFKEENGRAPSTREIARKYHEVLRSKGEQ